MNTEIADRIEKVKKRKVPYGYKKTQDGIYPIDWNYIRLGDYLEKYVERSKNDNKTPILTSSRNGLMLQSDYYTNREITVSEESEYGVIPRGYFTYRHMSDDITFKFNINNLCDKGLISPEYPVFKTKNLNDYFLLQKLNECTEFKRYAIINKKGSTRTRMYFSVLEELQMICPKINEQANISKILEIWDKHIELKAQLVDAKKLQKKGLMKKLLTGEVRLPGFYSEWEQLKFEEIIDTLSDYVANGSFASIRENVKYQDEGYAVLIRTQDFNNKFTGPFVYIDEHAYNFLNKSKLFEGDIIISNVGAVGSVFKVPCLDMPLSLAPNAILLRTNQNNEFIYQWLKSDIGQKSIKNITAVTAQPKFNKTDFRTMTIMIPIEKREQAEIARILSLFDKEIDLLERELLAIKLQKKGLMQLLLTGIVRVQC